MLVSALSTDPSLVLPGATVQLVVLLLLSHGDIWSDMQCALVLRTT